MFLLIATAHCLVKPVTFRHGYFVTVLVLLYTVYISLRHSNVNVVYIWFKYKDCMLCGRLKLYHVFIQEP